MFICGGLQIYLRQEINHKTIHLGVIIVSSSGKYVNEFTAMQITAVYSCVRILAEAVAGLPLHLYEYADTGVEEKAISHTLKLWRYYLRNKY